MKNLENDFKTFNEYHALLVEHAKKILLLKNHMEQIVRWKRGMKNAFKKDLWWKQARSMPFLQATSDNQE